MPAPPDRLVEAVERLVSLGAHPDRAHAERFIDYARANAIRMDSMWVHLGDGDRIVATVLAVPSPGRTAMFFASHARLPGETALVGRLIAHACGALGGETHLAQALLEPAEALDQQAFRLGGFTDLATLTYMERPLGRRRSAAPPAWPSGAKVESYREERRSDFLAALAASYEGTQDCPGLRGLRRMDDILDGHMATGRFEPALWSLLRVDGRPAGLLLLNPCPGNASIELVYLGLGAAVRGRGLGAALLGHGLSLLTGRSERGITLAVDEGNAPALKLYRTFGFRRVLRRQALIRALRNDRGGTEL